MKSKTSKALLSMIAIITILCLPIIAGAGAVPWTSVTYYADAQVTERDENQSIVFYDWNSHLEPFPGSATMNYNNGSGGYGTASSGTSSSYMQVQTSAFATIPGYEIFSTSSANYYGNYLGTTDLFQLSYNVTTDSMSPSPIFFIYDVTTSNYIVANVELPTGSGIINVSTPFGHDISIGLSLDTYSDSWNGQGSEFEGVKTNNASLNYSMSLVAAPEPISSILFLTGGATLIGRKYIRRKV